MLYLWIMLQSAICIILLIFVREIEKKNLQIKIEQLKQKFADRGIWP